MILELAKPKNDNGLRVEKKGNLSAKGLVSGRSEVDGGLSGESRLRAGDPPDVRQLEKGLGCCGRVRGKVNSRPASSPTDTSALRSISLRRENELCAKRY